MKLKFIVYMLVLVLFKPLCSTSYVSYSGSGGRLGDNLVSLMHGAYAAYINKVELLYSHFNYFDQLAVSKKLRPVSQIKRDHALNIKTFGSGERLNINPNHNTLYIIPYFPEGDWERVNCNCFKFETNWNDKQFLTYIRELIRPLDPQQDPHLDPAKLNIAIHIRRGGGVDSPLYSKYQLIRSYSDIAYPLKFPPFRYYVEQLQRIFTAFGALPIHVHLFTDDPFPLDLINQIKAKVTYNDVTFSYRIDDNSPYAHVLEDLFSITHFDILIRGTSNYAITADKLNDYLFVIAHLFLNGMEINFIFPNKDYVSTLIIENIHGLEKTSNNLHRYLPKLSGSPFSFYCSILEN